MSSSRASIVPSPRQSATSGPTVRLSSNSNSNSGGSNNNSNRASSESPSASAQARAGPLGLPILDGRHTAQNVCLYAMALGLAAGAGVWYSLLLPPGFTTVFLHALGATAALLACEYISSAVLSEADSLSAFWFPKARSDSILIFLALGITESWILLTAFGAWSMLSPLWRLVGRIGAVALWSMLVVRILSRVGPLTVYADKGVNKAIAASQSVFPYWVNARHAALFWWMLALTLVLRSPLTATGIVVFRHLLSDHSSAVYEWPEVVRRTGGSGGGFLGLALFDRRHTQQNIAAYAFCLGVLSGSGLAIGTAAHRWSGFGFFLAFLAIFHVFEYLTTAMFKANVSLSSFLLNHSREYHLAMIGGAVEFLLEVWLVPSLKGHYFIIYTGVLVVFASQMLRTVAMVTAGHNFSHIIAEYKEDDHKLVTTGVYSIFRHPSYTGFFYWSLGMQVVLGNPVCFCAFVVVLIKFFTSRIEFEEETLVEFFGDDYREYRKRTYTFIPSIPFLN